MQNNLTFRVWSYTLNRFLSKEEYVLDFDGRLVFVEMNPNDKEDLNVILHAVPPSSYCVQQFTGVQDDNKKDIYYGDILKDIGKVEFYKGAFRIQFVDNSGYLGWHSFCALRNLEIIGNVFENPELIPKPVRQ